MAPRDARADGWMAHCGCGDVEGMWLMPGLCRGAGSGCAEAEWVLSTHIFVRNSLQDVGR